MNGSSLEKASASARVLKMAMLPPSVNGPMPKTTPRATNLSTTALWRGYTAMIASMLAPDDSPMTTAFIFALRPTSTRGLQHAHAVALGIGERDVVSDPGYFHRLAEHGTARVSDLARRRLDIVHG